MGFGTIKPTTTTTTTRTLYRSRTPGEIVTDGRGQPCAIQVGDVVLASVGMTREAKAVVYVEWSTSMGFMISLEGEGNVRRHSYDVEKQSDYEARRYSGYDWPKS